MKNIPISLLNIFHHSSDVKRKSEGGKMEKRFASSTLVRCFSSRKLGGIGSFFTFCYFGVEIQSRYTHIKSNKYLHLILSFGFKNSGRRKLKARNIKVKK